MKEKILILYHSGAGSTKLTSEILASKLRCIYEVDIQHIDFDFDYIKLHDYDLLILGFPTYHCEPSTSMMDFINQIPKQNKNANVFFFTSYGLYSGNCLRIFYQELRNRNFIILGYYQLRSPASDGVLMFSSHLKFMFRFENTYKKQITKIVSQVKQYKSLLSPVRPIYKWYVPINEIAKKYGVSEYNKMRNKIHIIADRCINCDLCVSNCERTCWTSNKTMPIFESNNCEFCLKCIHQCPANAIIYSEKMKDKPRLNKKFFNQCYNRLISFELSNKST